MLTSPDKTDDATLCGFWVRSRDSEQSLEIQACWDVTYKAKFVPV